MRADESKAARSAQASLLRDFLIHQPLGVRIPIADWYLCMQELGLEHSDRQRLSELRKEGLLCPFDRKTKSYHYQGWRLDEWHQQDLPLTA